MVQSGKITFYTHPMSPFCQRVQVALEEAHAKYTTVEVDVRNKPAWFTEKVNPAGTIPALTYGPEGSPEDPAPGSTKIYESLVIDEFIADIFPESNLLPADPSKRAEARIIMTIFETKLFEGFRSFAMKGESSAPLIEAIEALQARLAPTGFAIGEFSIADIAVAPLSMRLVSMLENELGKYPLGEGKKVLDTLRGPKYARFTQYVGDLSARPSIKSSYDEAATMAMWKQYPAFQRD